MFANKPNAVSKTKQEEQNEHHYHLILDIHGRLFSAVAFILIALSGRLL
jgi:hypothetical protein